MKCPLCTTLKPDISLATDTGFPKGGSKNACLEFRGSQSLDLRWLFRFRFSYGRIRIFERIDRLFDGRRGRLGRRTEKY